MMKLNSNKGITLMVLILILIVIMLVLGITIKTGTESIDESIDTQFKSELNIIHHAVYEKYVECNATGEKYPGTLIENISSYTDFVNTYKKLYNKEPEGKYYLIKNEVSVEDDINSFEALGLSGERTKKSEFIVNYETGEVYNNTKKYYSNGKTPMYLTGYARDEKGNKISNEIQINNTNY